MTCASSIPLSSTPTELSQNINGFQTKITMRKRKQTRIVALGSLLRSLEVDFCAIQEPHFVTVEDRQAGMQCLSKYGYGLDGPLHEEGRGGVALAWKTSKWTLQSMKFLSPRALKASLSSGPLEITLVVAHFHHKHTQRQVQWGDIAKELHGPNLILCADHNSPVVKRRDAFAPPEFEHDTSLRAPEQEVTTLARATSIVELPRISRTKSRRAHRASHGATLEKESGSIHRDYAALTAYTRHLIC